LPEVTVDSFGNANASIPIQVPKGTKDITPSLEIEYNSLQSDGLIGAGWDLSGILTISLDPSEGIHNDEGDSYVSFAGKLVQTSPGVYHTKIESFFQFKKLADSWVVQDRNGVSYYFGEDGSGENPNSNSTLRNLSGNSRIWSLNRVRDRNGNGYNIRYQSYSSANGTPIVERIEYNQGNTVILFVDENRSDALESNFLNLQSKLTKRLRSVSVTQKQDDGSVVESERYTFNYNDNLFDKKDRLESLDRKNYGSISFKYNNDSPNPATSSTSKSSPSSIDMSYRYEDSSGKADCDLGKLICLCSANPVCMAGSGGSAGLLCTAFTMTIGDSCTNGEISSQTLFATFERGKSPEPVWVGGTINQNVLQKYSSYNPGQVTTFSDIQFKFNEKSKVLSGDINGDFVTDFAVLENDDSSIKLKISNVFSSNFQSISINPIMKNANSFQSLIDLNGDGFADYVQVDSTSTILIYLSNGTNLNTNPTILNVSGLGSSFQQFVDMDGDSIADFIRLSDNADGTKNLNISYLRYSGGTFSVRSNSTNRIDAP
ncbi:SpvB/TcaC N-terminal domain-containing protein, partial [Leptospira ellisii]|uniref:SpvB/TcaC N-terminal domain-containing protein n=1 Tax=Leptospira ellisii TaxID=2023197 RepID=UPI00243417B1